MQGKVIFIGAGPGDPELLTIKAAKVIEKADIIIYAGSLVNPQVLSGAKEGAEIHNSAHMNLDEIIQLMIESTRKGKTVARVHTGDPAIYGAIAEQIQYLKAQDVPYEIIPGVSSLFASAAALEAELTQPEVSQTVIITRPAGRTPKPDREAINLLAEHQATMCIFLGVHMIEKVVDELLTSYPKQTPVAVVQKASWEDEKIMRGTLEDIAQKVKDAGITKTALIVVGDVLGVDEVTPSKLYDAHFTHEYRNGKGK
ncbi:MAG: precorrin-4/cobalt-precorrin-4 C11-methyltransferase [Methanobacterium sp.]|jgi:precorrin-4/cobalt-precorrin-4 C11-methyltransferase|uniref:precorrin-4 C(11)-methyltransferase n=1 Tax=Methanobacterium sp. TaxID=2164 RepID=UPI0003C96E3E|nr:precorrin-4 C(11)-methyltransferase [Methanobacterium sp.]MDI3549367.1 precorrin-4/cobalt-precorrin-4 C11-methyltransferase [Methanobacterium sp.]CDG64928.1 putative cobalt-precorrin-4 C(11)-methyltransferase [Methanobacterium sp. MB1]